MRKQKGKQSKSHNRELVERQRELRMIKPPQVQFEIHQTHKLRFTNAFANPAYAVTFGNLMDTVLVAASATVAYELYDFVRIKEVEMWAAAGGNSGPNLSIGVDFGGLVAGNIGGGRSYEDTTVSNAVPAYIRCRPDPKSQTAQFQPASSSVAFHVRAPGAGARTVIIDVTLEFRNSPVTSPVVASVAAATSGEIYFRGLDGLNSGATAYPALLTPTI